MLTRQLARTFRRLSVGTLRARSAAQLQAARQRRLNKPHPAIIPDGIAAQLLAGAFDDDPPARLPQPELWPNYIARHAGSFSALGFMMVLISAWQLWRLPPQAIMEGKVIPTDWKIFGETNVSDHIAAKRLPRLLQPRRQKMQQRLVLLPRRQQWLAGGHEPG